MKIIKNEHQWIFESRDYRGKYQVRIQKDLSQFQIEAEMDGEWEGETQHVNTDLEEITMLRDMLTQAIKENE